MPAVGWLPQAAVCTPHRQPSSRSGPSRAQSRPATPFRPRPRSEAGLRALGALPLRALILSACCQLTDGCLRAIAQGLPRLECLGGCTPRAVGAGLEPEPGSAAQGCGLPPGGLLPALSSLTASAASYHPSSSCAQACTRRGRR